MSALIVFVVGAVIVFRSRFRVAICEVDLAILKRDTYVKDDQYYQQQWSHQQTANAYKLFAHTGVAVMFSGAALASSNATMFGVIFIGVMMYIVLRFVMFCYRVRNY